MKLLMVPESYLRDYPSGTYRVPPHRLNGRSRQDILAPGETDIDRLIEMYPYCEFVISQDSVTRMVTVEWKRTGMTTEQMRIELSKLYSGKSWRDKVNKMSDAQVFAVYNRMKRERKI